mmetsp:Transcript_6113/g.8901  ORF Transcript_6113/g.8901 Transcript_6113/m.8901 type:complete len:449 (+) Transcript_6113:12-1358(+)
MKLLRITLLTWCVIIISMVMINPSYQLNLRGVNPKYENEYKSDNLVCDGGKTQLKPDQINDNYCDCEDGFDEPGTAACSHLIQPIHKFHCQNAGYFSKDIFQAYVDDGICDCCDGSDEKSGACENTCHKMGKDILAELKKERDSIQRGVQKRQIYIEQAESEIISKRKELKEKKIALETLKPKLEHAEKAKNSAESQERVEKDLLRVKLEKEQAEENKKEVVEEKVNEEETKEEVQKEDVDKPTTNDPPKLKQFWNAKGELETIVEEDEEKVEEKKEEKVEEKKEEPEQLKSFKTEEAENARNAYNVAKRELEDVEKSIRDIENLLKGNYGESNEFFTLRSHCFTIQDRQYTYELCPYNSVNQKSGGSSTLMGSFDKFEDNLWIFSNGQSCWQGPNRSTKVTLECGAMEKIVNVDEPSKCEYTMTFQTPAACTKDTLKNVEKKLNLLK